MADVISTPTPETLIMRPSASQQPDQDHFVPSPENQLRADPSRREAVQFMSSGLKLAGHLYRPPNAPTSQKTPAITMCGPISAVKEQVTPHYAQKLAEAGYTVLTFDSRNFGASEGEPRQHYDPNEVILDYHHAVSYLLTRDDVDADSVAAVGVCMGGGYTVSLAAMDKRVKAAVSVAGGYNIGGTFQQQQGVKPFARFYRMINNTVQEGYVTGEPQYVPVIAQGLDDDTPIAVMPNAEAYSFYDRTSKDHAPNWKNRMTAASLEPYFLYNSVVHAPLVAPTPLLIVHGTRDMFLLPEYAQAAYDAYPADAGDKELVWLETHNHIELYDQDPYVSLACEHVVRFLNERIEDSSSS